MASCIDRVNFLGPEDVLGGVFRRSIQIRYSVDCIVLAVLMPVWCWEAFSPDTTKKIFPLIIFIVSVISLRCHLPCFIQLHYDRRHPGFAGLVSCAIKCSV